MRLALAALLTLVLAAPARAQDDDHVPVVGGGSFNAAPILEPGRYRDTILPAEYLYYGFRVGAGQRLHVTATTTFTDAELRDVDVLFISANLHSPTRALRSYSNHPDDHFWLPNSDNVGIEITGEEATVDEDSDTKGPWTGPGVNYLAFHAITGLKEAKRAEIPIRFEVELLGTEQAVATPTPTPTPSPTPSPTASPTPAPIDDGSGASPALAAGFGFAGLVLGAIGGLALRQRRR